MTVSNGLVIVDKPGGWTSHDVVARIRRLAGTRRVGHAGTLDPAATGVLVVGVERATRVLGHLGHTDKAYDAVIRLGERTTTDDAEGEVVTAEPATGISEEDVRRAVRHLTGRIMQIPPQVSAVKVGGRRAYKLARAGEDLALKPRPATVHEFAVSEIARVGELLDVEASVVCSTGTYVRALARDLGDGLGVGGHLTWLRRTRVGPYTVSDARTLDELARSFRVLPLSEAVAAAFPRREVSAGEVRRVAHGGRLPAAGIGPGPVGVFGPDGELLALVEESGGVARPLAVFAG
ncbi:MAG: tRNA pseudouridine(55) synthase TruB [Streptosporangiaceae bacterium]